MSINEIIKKYLNDDVECQILCDFYEKTQIYKITNGNKKVAKNVLITAGSHAEETAGIEGCLKVIPYIQDVNFCVIPTRDPLGYHGMMYIEDKTPSQTYMFDVNLFKIMVLEFPESYYIKTVDSINIDFNDLIKLCKQFDHYVRFKPFYPIIISIAYYKQHNLDRVHSIYFNEDRIIKHYNTDFFNSKEKSIHALRKLIDTEMFDLIIDCHEGYGNGMYLYINDQDKLMITNVIQRLKKENVSINNKTEKGYIIKNSGTSLQDYGTKTNAISITIETGSLDSFDKRVKDLVKVINFIIDEVVRM